MGAPRRRGAKVDPSPAKAQPVYYRSIIEIPLSLTLLGELLAAQLHQALIAREIAFLWTKMGSET